MTKSAISYCGADHTIEQLRASHGDWKVAAEDARNPDYMSELICRAAENLCSAEGLVRWLFAHRAA